MKIINITYTNFSTIVVHIGSLLAVLGLIKWIFANFLLNQNFNYALRQFTNDKSEREKMKETFSFQTLNDLIIKVLNIPEAKELK